MKILIKKKWFNKLKKYDSLGILNKAKLNVNLVNYLGISYEIKSMYLRKFIKNVVSPILIEKKIKDKAIDAFVESFLNNVEPEDMSSLFTNIDNPPFQFSETINKIIDIEEMCKENNIENVDWLIDFKFPGGSNVGMYEGFMKVLYRDMFSPAEGDVGFNNKGILELIEVKGEGGRLKGQEGYRNGMIALINKLIKDIDYTLPKGYSYKLSSETINTIKQKITVLESEIISEFEKYNLILENKKKSMDEAFLNKKAIKKYEDRKEAYEKYKNKLPAKLRDLPNEIEHLKLKIKENTLETISMKFAEISMKKCVEFWVNLFFHKYFKYNDTFDTKNKIEEFVKRGLYEDGSFNDKFLIEYFIFEYEYYQFVEGFNYLTLVNNDGKTLTIDSNEKFREFVNLGIITFKSIPQFGDKAGTQGEVFALTLKIN